MTSYVIDRLNTVMIVYNLSEEFRLKHKDKLK